jgi:hypothetical protein
MPEDSRYNTCIFVRLAVYLWGLMENFGVHAPSVNTKIAVDEPLFLAYLRY